MHIIHPKYRRDIDGLRAIAVLLVIGYHAFPTYVGAGFIGVDIFFVISGYLISTIIFHSLELNRFSLLEFYNRRIRRIFPSLVTILAFGLGLGWFVLLPGEYGQLGKHIAGGAGFISNFVLLRESGYFDVAAHKKVLLHLWSLAIEEQFYIFWPLLLVVIGRLRFSFLRVTVAIAVLSFATNLWLLTSHPDAAFYLPLSRVWELMLGGLLAFMVLNKAHPGPSTRNIYSFCGFSLLLSASLFIDTDSAFPGYWALLPTVGSFLIIYAGPEAWLNAVVLSNRFMVFVGLISYPLYLWHWPLLTFANFLQRSGPSREIRVAAVGAAFALAWLTYLLIEKPFRFGGRDRLKAAALLVLMFMVGGAGGITMIKGGYRDRIPPLSSSLDEAAFVWGEHKLKNQSCLDQVGIKDLGYCLISEGYQPSVALIGDSHANAIFDAVSYEAAGKGKGVVMLGMPGCPPFLGVYRSGDLRCPQAMEEIAKYVTAHDEIKEVIITARFAATYSGKEFGKRTVKNFYPLKMVGNAAMMDRKEIFETGFASMLQKLNAANKEITVALDVPELNFDPRGCGSSGKNCSVAVDAVRERQRGYTESILRLKERYHFAVVDPKEILCKEGVCTAKSNDKILYRDSHHLGIYGNELIEKSGFEFLGSGSEETAGVSSADCAAASPKSPAPQ